MADTRTYQDLLAQIYLHVHWYDVSKRLTTEQKEAWADAVEAASRRLNGDGGTEPMIVPRWWRPGYVPPKFLGEAALKPPPVRRVNFEVTAYLRHGHPLGGFYDLQSQPDGGLTFSIPEGAVDERTIRDVPAEQLTADDWSEIEGQVRARLGKERAAELLKRWRGAAVLEVEGNIDG